MQLVEVDGPMSSNLEQSGSYFISYRLQGYGAPYVL